MERPSRSALLATLVTLSSVLALTGCDGGADECVCRAIGGATTIELTCGETRCIDEQSARCDADDGLIFEGTCGTSDVDAGPGVDAGPVGGTLCSDECSTSGDGECDDGGEGALYDVCDLGTDCTDCGPREGGCTPSCGGRECGGDGCGGSCGTCSSGSCPASGTCSTGGCEGAPRCEGNDAVSCDGAITVRETCADRCEAGACVTDPPPSSVTITGAYGSATPFHSASASLVSIAATPSFAPELDTLPNLLDQTPTSLSPSPGACDVSLSITLNRSQVGAMISGSGAACTVYIDRVASEGFEARFDDAPLQSGGGTIDVTLELSP